ncbi:8-oxoguanine deaminase [Mangrovimicrobium sediminis]|uniref:8-oxoguanine deaminase n=1 Tax=Mangrovimicrobium sediminis TaxID=2562682 RepID=A0A4Z0M5B9_9GAMM|nr:8-oxoguanine deaminase [Haliea sp. SAOS-164]TGD74610.1 8-oxoguanine deaminase [Haliea sp. SAOS-164]
MAAKRLWIANPAAAYSPDIDVDCRGGVVVAGKRILECVPAGSTPRAFDDRLDADGLVLLPGLINCHHHFYQTLTRALPAAQDRELFDWLRALYPVWAQMDEQSIAAATELALTEMLLSGCTTAADHHYLFADAFANAIDIQVAVARRLGMRVVLTRGSMSLGESRGGLPPDSVVQDEQVILEDCTRLVREYHERSEDAMVQIAFAPCSPFSVSAELMHETAHLARKSGVRLHTHLAETEDENRFCLENFGRRPLDHLEELGWMGDDVWLAHGIHFEESEIARLGAARVGICHCPSSNMILASGLCPVLDLEGAGAPVGLGVDGSASNDHSNLMEEVRQAFLLQRLHYGSASVSVGDALRWATRGGARVLGRSALGSLRPGNMADLALFELGALRFSGAGDPLLALVTCGASQAKHVMINGEWCVTDGAVPGVDLGALKARHREAAARLRERAQVQGFN